MLVVVLTVSLAAFLQGFVQSSINGASLYADLYGLRTTALAHSERGSFPTPTTDDWKLGAANASPYLSAALLGCWLALPINDRVGRRGAMAIAAGLIFASSLGAAFCTTWQQLLGIRVINGIGQFTLGIYFIWIKSPHYPMKLLTIHRQVWGSRRLAPLSWLLKQPLATGEGRQFLPGNCGEITYISVG
jgi:MFS family permease